MRNAHKPAPSISQRQKLAAIPVLALILLWVVFRGDPSEKEDPAATVAAEQSPAAAASPMPSRQSRPPGGVSKDPIWPAVGLDDALRRNPFDVPQQLRPAPPPAVVAVPKPAVEDAGPTAEELAALAAAEAEAEAQAEADALAAMQAAAQAAAEAEAEAARRAAAEAEAAALAATEAEAEAARRAAAEAEAAALAAAEAEAEAAAQVAAEEQARWEDLALRLQSWRSRPVSLIYSGPKGRAALIGAQIVAEGDLVEEGIRVLEISPYEVVLGLDL